MNILITGGAGFIGSSLAKSLLEDGHEISIVDNYSTGRLSNISDIHDKITFIEMDLANLGHECTIDINYLLSRADVVYHLAASIGVDLINNDPKGSLVNNTKIDNNLFLLFEKYQNRVIFSSTSEVYGETKNKGGSKETDKLEILPPHTSRGGYACSKLMSEFMLKTYTFPYTVVRLFNIVGPSQSGDYGHVLPRFINCINTNEPLKVYGTGQQVRSFCDIRDCVEMLKLLMDDIHNGEIYNTGNPDNYCSITELAEVCIKQLGGTRIEYVPLDFDDISVRYPNTDKISQYYRCKYSLDDIIKYVIRESV